VLLLAEHFLQEFCRQLQRPAGNLTPEAARELLQYQWPGNIRELRNCMERLALRCHGTTISAAEVRQALGLVTAPEPGNPGEGAPGEGRIERLAGQVNILERGLIMRVLAETGGNKAEAARRLGVSRTTLWRKLKEENKIDKAGKA
jgi:DNA-binding NtrC family response regulator